MSDLVLDPCPCFCLLLFKCLPLLHDGEQLGIEQSAFILCLAALLLMRGPGRFLASDAAVPDSAALATPFRAKLAAKGAQLIGIL